MHKASIQSPKPSNRHHYHDTMQSLVCCVVSCAAPPTSPPAFCSILLLPESAEVSFQWSSSFTSQHAVERYRVSVTPDPSSCSSDQVSPSEDYRCSGLVLGSPLYTIALSAINCEDQEGDQENITITTKG